MKMDKQLEDAVWAGDVEFLKKALAVQPSEYFLAQTDDGRSIFHLAQLIGKAEFIQEVMNNLPTNILKQLLLITDKDKFNPLHGAAKFGDVELLKKALAVQPSEYFLAQIDDGSSIFHLAVQNGKVEFIQEAMNNLPRHIVKQLLLITDEDLCNPLHTAAMKGDVELLKKALAVQPSEYFLAQTNVGSTIFHLAIQNGKEDFMNEAMNILPTNILKQLLIIADNYSFTPLHNAALYGNFSVIKCVKKMYGSLSWDDDEDHVKPWLALNMNNKTPLNLALRDAEVDEKGVMEIMLMDPEHDSWTIADKYGNTPLYNAVKKGLNLVAEKIVMCPLGPTSLVCHPKFSDLFTNHSGYIVELLKKGGYFDIDGNTPLHSALNSKSTEELALQILSAHPTFCIIFNNKGESPFFLAVRSGCEQVVGRIARIEEPRFHMLRRNDRTTVLHCLSSCTEKTGLMLLEKYWWLMNLRDDQGKTALDYAKLEKTYWLVNLLTNPSLFKKQDFDWEDACIRKEADAVLAFIDNCPDLERVCRKGNDTLLHHVILPTFKDYQNFLKIPSIAEFKNTTDRDGATPLHCALKREDINFARALLCDNEVNRIIRDRDGITSMDLLAELCKDNADWERMCKQINVNPLVRTTYIQPGTNLAEMRNTLSVIAALLSTITFAAGFTLPGGINSDNGQALLGKKAAFIVFLLADVYAMCTSMLVLFCLVWSMVSKLDMAQLLVDRSVFILMQSLYATLLAFMTGVYIVIEHSSLWAAIVIFVMCSIIGIVANRTILHKVIDLLIPGVDREERHQTEMLEQELLEVRTES